MIDLDVWHILKDHVKSIDQILFVNFYCQWKNLLFLTMTEAIKKFLICREIFHNDWSKYQYSFDNVAELISCIIHLLVDSSRGNQIVWFNHHDFDGLISIILHLYHLFLIFPSQHLTLYLLIIFSNWFQHYLLV